MAEMVIVDVVVDGGVWLWRVLLAGARAGWLAIACWLAGSLTVDGRGVGVAVVRGCGGWVVVIC